MQRIALILFVLFGTADISAAASNGPIPSTAEQSAPQQEQTAGKNSNPNIAKQIGAPSVTIGNPIKTASQTDNSQHKTFEKPSTDLVIDIITFGLFLVGIFQVGLFWRQLGIMKSGIKDATTAADAAKDTAEALRDNVVTTERNAKIFRERMEKQSRAYLTTNFGGGWYQDRATNTHFGLQVMLINTGHTPAKHVRNKIRCGILPSILTENTQFPLPEVWSGDGLIGPGQNFSLGNIMPDYIDDERAVSVKGGDGPERLYVWGIVTYIDVFDEPHILKFCHTIHWFADGKTWSYMTPYHNEGD